MKTFKYFREQAPDQESASDDTEKENSLSNQIKSKENRQRMIKKQVLLKKLQAVRAGDHKGIVAHYEPEGELVEGVMKFVKSIGRKKAAKRKPQMDPTTKKLNQWRKDREQEDREKYVSPFRPIEKEEVQYNEGMIDVIKKGAQRHSKAIEKKKIKNRKAVPYAALAAQHEPEGEMIEAKVDDVKYSKDEKRKNYETDVHTLSSNKGVRSDRNKRRSATDVIFHGHSKVERDRKQAHYKSRGVKKVKGVKEEVVVERLGGKGYKPYTDLRGKKVSGDWEDSDRGGGHKWKEKVGKPVKKKSPTYLAHVHNKKVKEEVVDEGIRKAIKKGVRLGKREASKMVVDDPGGMHTYGSLGNPKPGDKAKRDKERAAKKKVNEEDKAFNFVLDKIRKEVGKDGYVSKDNPRKPQSAADKAKARAHQAKVDAENAAERRKDPSQGRYPKG